MNTQRRVYPPLDGPTLALQLEAIRSQLDFDPEYLNDPTCPWPEKLKIFLRRLVIPSQVNSRDLVDGVFRPGQTSGDQVESLIEEVQLTINQMKALSSDMTNNGDVGERMTFFKNYAPLIDRFLAMQEKAQGMKMIYEFQRIVMIAMEEVMTKDQRLDLKERLRKANVPDVREPVRSLVVDQD